MSANGERSPRYAILIVNGYDRHGLWGDYSSDEAQRFPWIELCLRQVERHSAGADYEVLVYDNSWLTSTARCCGGMIESASFRATARARARASSLARYPGTPDADRRRLRRHVGQRRVPDPRQLASTALGAAHSRRRFERDLS